MSPVKANILFFHFIKKRNLTNMCILKYQYRSLQLFLGVSHFDFQYFMYLLTDFFVSRLGPGAPSRDIAVVLGVPFKGGKFLLSSIVNVP